MGGLTDIIGNSLVPVQLAADVVTNAINAGSNMYADREARLWQEEMWKKQNEYNLPVNQVARLKDAGINPNTSFGSSSSALGTTVPSSPTTHPAHFNFSNFAQLRLQEQIVKQELAERAASTHRKEQENRLFDSLIDKMIEENGLGLDEKMMKHRWFLSHGERMMDVEKDSKELNLDLMRFKRRLMNQKGAMNASQWRFMKSQWAYLKSKYEFEKTYYDKGLLPPGQGYHGSVGSIITGVKEGFSAIDRFFDSYTGNELWEDLGSVFDDFGGFLEDLWQYGL